MSARRDCEGDWLYFEAYERRAREPMRMAAPPPAATVGVLDGRDRKECLCKGGRHRDDPVFRQVTYRCIAFALFFFECLKSSIDERTVNTSYHNYLRYSHTACSATSTRRSTIDMNDGNGEYQQQQHDPVHGRHAVETNVYFFVSLSLQTRRCVKSIHVRYAR